MVSKRREGFRGSRVKSGRKEFWQVLSRSMEEKSGFVNSALSPMRGRGGVAEDVTTTSWQDCGKVEADSCGNK